MDINYLQDFIVLSEKGNFLQAAEDLYISQPALTRHIMALEKKFGAKVFDRTTRRIELNEYGRYILPYAKEIIRLYEECKDGLQDIFKEAGSLIIGSIPPLKQFNIIDLLALFKLEYPNCDIKVIEETTDVMIELLMEGKCDFAFIRRFKKYNENLGNNIQKILIDTDPVVAVLQSKHPMANMKSVTIAQLKNENFLLLKAGMLYTKLQMAFEAMDCSPNISFAGMRIESVIDMAAKGMGVAFVLKSSALLLDNQDISIVDIDPADDFTVINSLAYLKSRKMNPASLCFLDVVKKWKEGGGSLISP